MAVTNDLGFAAYLIVKKNLKLLNHPTKDNKAFRFQFDISDDELNLLYLEYVSTDYCKFDRTVKWLRKLLNKYHSQRTNHVHN